VSMPLLAARAGTQVKKVEGETMPFDSGAAVAVVTRRLQVELALGIELLRRGTRHLPLRLFLMWCDDIGSAG
jgi:hypothetical protein